MNLNTEMQIKSITITYLMRDSRHLKREESLINQLAAIQDILEVIFLKKGFSPFITLMRDNILQKSKK